MTELSWKNEIPQIIYDERLEYIELYNYAWTCARDHVLSIPGMPQNPYVDEAFCRTRIWIWDTCFMALFCKYAPSAFPGVESLYNFWEVMHGAALLPAVFVPDGEPEWTGAQSGTEAPIRIQHPDNPPLFAWVYYENMLFRGDVNSIRKLLLEKQYLQKHYFFLENLKESAYPKYSGAKTYWRKFPDGYKWRGTPSGMDNTPRGRRLGTDEILAQDDFFWVDALAQQALSAKYTAKLARLIGDFSLEQEWLRDYEEKKELLNRLYWDEEDGFYYDIAEADHHFRKIKTPASFWPLLAECASPEQARRCIEKVEDPKILGGRYPWCSVSRDDFYFDHRGGSYWRGGIWAPSVYSGIRALVNYGYLDLAREKALQNLEQVWQTYHDIEPHTIWEAYAPDQAVPATCPDGKTTVRPNFCGWSALIPINLLIENIIGIYYADAFTETLKWHLPATINGRVGCKNFHFGNIVCDLVAEKQECSVYSNRPFCLELNGQRRKILAGMNKIQLFS